VQTSLSADVSKWQNETRAQVERNIKQVETYKDGLDKLNAELSSIKGKISEGSTVVGNASSLPPTDKNVVGSHSTCGSAHHPESEGNHRVSCVNVDDASGRYGTTLSNNQVPSGIQSDMKLCMPSNQVCSASSFIAPSDLTLPYFHDCAKVNAVFFLKQLDDFMKLKAVPVRFQLAIARKAVTDPIAVDWLSAIAPNLQDYEQFKVAFRRNFWPASKQSIVKCSSYQDRYQKGLSLSMSEHFLKYAVLASYLVPKMTDVELMDALKFHFPIYVQNSFAAAQLTGVQDALDLLKRLEGIEIREELRRANSAGSSQNQGLDRSHGGVNGRYNWANDRPQPQGQPVRQGYVQHRPPHQHRRSDDWNSGRPSAHAGPRGRQNGTGPNCLNPLAKEFTSRNCGGDRQETATSRQQAENC
jgi:hypothetical protein